MPKGQTVRTPEDKPKERKPRTPELLPPKAERPMIRMSYGMTKCLFCKRDFERSRPWSKFDTPYCRTSYFHHTHRRVNPAGQIVEVDGQKLAQPREVFDPHLVEQVERETAGTMGAPRE